MLDTLTHPIDLRGLINRLRSSRKSALLPADAQMLIGTMDCCRPFDGSSKWCPPRA